jgi:hypothetical protein
LPHELGSIDFGSGGNDLGFTDSLLSSSGRKGLLELDREVDILEQDGFDGNSPFLSGGFDLIISLMSRGR